MMIQWPGAILRSSLSLEFLSTETLCSQKWFKVWDFTDNFIQKIEKALNKFQTDFVDTFEHENYSADIYVDERHQGIHLIEVNPWGNSGPGLFNSRPRTTFQK